MFLVRRLLTDMVTCPLGLTLMLFNAAGISATPSYFSPSTMRLFAPVQAGGFAEAPKQIVAHTQILGFQLFATG